MGADPASRGMCELTALGMQRESSKGECSLLGLSRLPWGPWAVLTELQNIDSHEWWGSLREKKACSPLLLVLNIASDLLGLDAFQLSEVLTQRSMILRGEEISSPLTVEQVSVLACATASAVSTFPGPLFPSGIVHSGSAFPVTPHRCSAVSSSILPLLVVEVPILTLLFRLYRGVHLQMHGIGFKSPSLARNWSCLCHAEDSSDTLW